MAQYSNSTRHPTQCTMALEESKTQVYQIDASRTQRGLLVHLISTKHLVAHPCTNEHNGERGVMQLIIMQSQVLMK